MALGVDIISAFDGSGIKKAIEEFKTLETTSQKAQFAIQKAAIPAAAALAGLAAAAGFAVKAAIADQQEQEKLALTIRNTTDATTGQIEANEEYIASLAASSTFTDSEMRPALEALVRTTGDLSTAQSSLRLAMDISAATGQGLVEVSSALARAHTGNYRALQMLSPMLRDNIKEGQSLDQIFKELTDTFGGSAEAMGETTAGQLTRLKNQVGELQESFGVALLPVVEAIVPVFSSLATFAQNNRTAFLALAGVLATLSASIVAVAAVTKIYTTYQKLMAIDTVQAVLALKDAEGQLTKVGQAVMAVGKVFAVVALAQTFFAIGNSAMNMGQKIKVATEEVIIAVDDMAMGTAQDTATVAESFIKTARTIQDQLRLNDVFNEFGRDFQFVVGGIKVNIEAADEAFENFLNQDPNLAQKIIDGLKAQLAVTDPTSRAYQDLTDAIARYEARLNTARAAQSAFNSAVQTTPTLAWSAALVRLETQTQREFKARLASAGAIEEWNKQVEQSRNKASGAAKEVKTFQEKLTEFTSALKGSYDAQRSMTAATRSREAAERSVTEATANASKAQEYFNKVVKGFPKDSKQAIDATRQYEEAQRRVRDAALSQRDAIQEVKNAEAELQKLRDIKADPENVAEAERNLERSKYAVEEANFAVTEAEAELAALRLNPESSATEIRRAEIRLAEAKLAVSDSVARVKDAELALNEEINRKATAEEIAEAERNLEKAKESVVKQTEELRDATVQEAAAQSFMNQILNGATEDTDEYKDALRELTEAKREEEDARINVAEAILNEAEATLALAEAQRILNKVRAETPANIVARGQAQLEGVSTSNPALAALNAANNGQNNTTVINNNITAGMGTDPATVAREIIDVLKSYERANGYVPIVTEYQVAV
jgi:hypothetical protein